jgi:hypothetical protein
MSSYWQGKGAGKKIAIRFTKPLLGDVTGNEDAFTIKGMVRSPLKYGPLTERTFTVESVERYPLEQYWQDDFAGDMDGLEAGEYGLGLEQTMGKALELDGVDDYINCGDHSSLRLSAALTIEAQIKANSFGTETFVSNIVSKDATAQGYCLRVGNGTVNMVLQIGGSWKELNGITSIGTNKEAHIACTYDGQKMRVYLNGKLDNEASQTGSISTGSAALQIGRRTGSDRYFDGVVGDVRIWNVARTQQEIQDNMNKELSGNETGLVGYWKINEGSGLTAYDSAGNNNGTIYGATWTDGIIGSYPDEGTYTLSLDATELPENPRFRCEASTPDDTAIIIEYACTAGDEPDSEGWAEIEDGDLLTITADTLWLRYTLTTDNPAVTPTLLSAWLEESDAPPGTILLTMAPDSRFNDVEGDLTVSYEREKGTLTGTRPVEDFEETFTPTDLEPTPIDRHDITAGIEVAVDLIKVDYIDLGHKNTITAGITVEVDLIPVSEIPP